MDLDIKVYQAEYNQRLKEAEEFKKADLAASTLRFNEEKAFADQWKRENTASLAQSLKDKAISQADYNAQLKEINAQHAAIMRDANALRSTLNKEANTGYTSRVNDAKTFLADQKSAIAAEQKRLKDQFDSQTKLSAQAQKEALANLAFERAFYTKADYDKKVAEVKNDFARINEGLKLSYNAIQGMPAARREEYLSGGIGSLAAAQEMLTRSREQAAAAPPAGSVVVPRAQPAPVVAPTPAPTPQIDPSIAASFLAAQQAPTTAAPAPVSREREQVTEGLGSPAAQAPVPTLPQLGAMQQQQGSPYESVFGRQEQFPYLQAPVNPYMQPGQPQAQQPQQPGQVGLSPMERAVREQTPLLFDVQQQGALGQAQAPQTLQTITGQTPPAQQVLPGGMDYFQTSPLTQSAQYNPYLAPYQSLLQTARPVQEEEEEQQGRPVTQTAGMF